jgi:hypothetical protein
LIVGGGKQKAIKQMYKIISGILMKIFRKTNVMSETEIKSKAFLVYCEFGPDRRIPREKRLKEKFPTLTIEQIDVWINEYTQYEKIAFDIAIQHRREKWKAEDTIKMLSNKIPGLKEEAISKLLNQACYFAMHDGY